MKNFFLILFLCFIISSVNGQRQSIIVNYTFKIQTPEGGTGSFDKILKCNEESSIFVDSGIVKNTGKGKVMVNDKKLDKGFYYDKTSNISIYFSPIFSKVFYVKEDTMIGLFKWTLIDSLQKKILDFNCKAAKCCFRGRNYVAYYTDEVGISAGPWKFCGLPGLILEIGTTDNKYSYTAYSFTSQNEKIVIMNPYKGLEEKFLSFKEHKNLFLKKLSDNQNKVRTEEKEKDVEISITDNSMELIQ